MASEAKRKQKKIILIILCLVLSIAGTTFIFMDRIRTYLPNDEGAISIVPEDDAESKENEVEVDTEAETGNDSLGAEDSETSSEVDTSKPGNVYYNPELQSSDDNQVWGKSTQVEIFRISYSDDGSEEITIKANDGDNLIAPGSENSYTFKLKNTGDVAMDYTVTIDAYISPADIHIPVEARISRHDQKWITGSGNQFEGIPELNGTVDNYTLGAGRYSAYTLDWTWPFESGDDEWDTFLGNEAVEQDITLTIKINTVATVSANAGATGGMIPQTGDAANATLYIIMMLSALLIMFILLFYREKEEGEQYE